MPATSHPLPTDTVFDGRQMSPDDWQSLAAGARLGGFVTKKGKRYSARLAYSETEGGWKFVDPQEEPIDTQPIRPPVKLRNALPPRPRREEYLPAVRVSTAEAAAARVFLGGRAWATVARELVCGGNIPIKSPVTPAGTATVDKHLRYHVARWGNNLNQLTRLANEGKLGGEAVLKELESIRAALEALLK